MDKTMRERMRGMVGTPQPNGSRLCSIIEPEVDWRTVMEAAEQYIVWLEYIYGIGKDPAIDKEAH